MRLHRLWLKEFKNLRDVTIDFDQEHWVTVVIGWNGTGKSNVLEALATIFRELIDRPKQPPFAYDLIYECRGRLIRVRTEDAEKLAYSFTAAAVGLLPEQTQSYDDFFEASGEKVAKTKFTGIDSLYLPEYVFGYYSGFSDRMAQVFRSYTEQYDKKLRGGEDPGLKRLFYAQPVHSQFVLLAFLLQQDDAVRSFLDEQLGIDPDNGVDSVLFVLSQPPWNSKEGDSRFWNAKGVVQKFLADIYGIALAPIRLSRRSSSSNWNKKTREYLHLYVKDTKTLRQLLKNRQPREFFRDLESTHVSELVDEVRIRVKLRKNDGSVVFRELSEGEQQLLTVLGLLRFTAAEESLLLLDEPGTHLNPRWSTDYLAYLQQFVGTESVNSERSHVVLTTHNPLAIAELEKEQIQILTRNKESNRVAVQSPEFDPRGMGYAGIVTSDMFGLDSSLDSYTNKLLEQKNALVIKSELSSVDKEMLANINKALAESGFQTEVRDPVYKEYLRARAALADAVPAKDDLTSDERREKAKRLVKQALVESSE